MFVLEANLGPVREQMYYLSRSKFVRCSYFLEVAAIEYNMTARTLVHRSIRIYRIEYMTH